MPIVESSTCRTATKSGEIQYTFAIKDEELVASNTIDITYTDCDGDLTTQYKTNNPGDDASLIDKYLVGEGGCAADLAEYLNEEHFLIEGVNPNRYITPNPYEWEQIIGKGTHFLPPIVDATIADAEFRDKLEVCLEGKGRHCILRRVCDSCTSVPHRDIYYKRLTALPPPGTNTTAGEVYFLNMFMNRWASYKNVLNTDFELYSSYEDAMAGTNKWLYCNYDELNHPVGFPRDCAPISWTGDQWNSYSGWNPEAGNHHGYYVETCTEGCMQG
jgi:hypothetical protein